MIVFSHIVRRVCRWKNLEKLIRLLRCFAHLLTYVFSYLFIVRVGLWVRWDCTSVTLLATSDSWLKLNTNVVHPTHLTMTNMRPCWCRSVSVSENVNRSMNVNINVWLSIRYSVLVWQWWTRGTVGTGFYIITAVCHMSPVYLVKKVKLGYIIVFSKA